MTDLMEDQTAGAKPALSELDEAAIARRKQAAWWDTIFWMLKMILLFNLVAWPVGYFIFKHYVLK